MVTAYRGQIKDGKIELKDSPALPEGVEVIVVLVEAESEFLPERGITGAELLASPMVGIWADRDDIGDTVEFARELRRKSEQRGSSE